MSTDIKPYSEALRYHRQKRGWSQQRVAEQIGTSEDMVSRWERGTSMPGPFYREKLCTLFQADSEELGFLARGALHPTPQWKGAKRSALLKSEERDGCFSFGKLKTTWKTLDGDGRGIYLPHHIRTHYIPFAQKLPEELQVRRDHIQQEQEQNKAQGSPFSGMGRSIALIVL
jgi:transcriptional regulator with XRE-family HTH domain